MKHYVFHEVRVYEVDVPDDVMDPDAIQLYDEGRIELTSVTLAELVNETDGYLLLDPRAERPLKLPHPWKPGPV